MRSWILEFAEGIVNFLAIEMHFLMGVWNYEEDAFMKKMHFWRRCTYEENALMKKMHLWRKCTYEEDALMKKMHYELDALMKKMHLWRNALMKKMHLWKRCTIKMYFLMFCTIKMHFLLIMKKRGNIFVHRNMLCMRNHAKQFIYITIW